MRFTLAGRKARARSQDGIFDSIIYLILNRTISRPTARHKSSC
jgi:hypothetical protein